MKMLRTTAAILALSAFFGLLSWATQPSSPALDSSIPKRHNKGGYLGSSACRSCHPGEHASWSRSYHQSMTRRSSELRWDGELSPELPAKLELHSRFFHLHLGESGVVYRGPDLHAIGAKLAALAQSKDSSKDWRIARAEEFFASAREVTRRLPLITGSHHYLAFWVEGGKEKELRQLPFVYLIDESRFLARKDAFLQPPDALPRLARFNANCIQCHTVAGRPEQSEGFDPDTGQFWESYKSEAAELGIACESCHGSGKRHAELYRNPLHRAQARRSGRGEYIFVPRPEAGARGSETCGQCHSYFLPTDPNEWWTSGFSESYASGDSLASSRTLLRPPETFRQKGPESLKEPEDPSHSFNASLDSVFWKDGSIIVGGREFNGLIRSPCFLEGRGKRKLACTSCHSIHEGDADNQLSPRLKGDRMCTQCHESIGSQHSRHSPGSAGARCTNCHMPRRSYALLQGITSHQISSPGESIESPPDACALCHVDRTRAWLNKELVAFGVSQDEVSTSEREDPITKDVPLAVIGALRGNAAERAVYAFALGSQEALESSGPEIATQVLPTLCQDSYAAVRLIAARSLRRVKNYQKAPRAKDQDKTHTPKQSDKNYAKSPPFQLLDALRDHLIKRRDNTPIVISE